MPNVETLARLEDAIALCRTTISEHERAVAVMTGRPGENHVVRLVALYHDLLARQLKHRDELLSS